MKRPLRVMPESSEEAWIGGVCSGLAYWLGWPTWLIRLAFFLGLGGSGGTLFIYGLMWLVLEQWDEVPEDYREVTGG